jgi:ring-1,2-phenylacetyl-CoA epoxidase subunit PaaC
MADDTRPDPHGDHFHDSAYDGLLEDHHAPGDDSQWAFGTDFEDPLAGVDTTVPEGVDHAALAAYCLMLGDDALVYSHRLSEWCSRAPDLEEDIALANVALDLLGQARLLLARAAAADGGVVPALPEGSPVPPEDALAFFRDDRDFRNVRLVEPDNGDFAVTIVRLLLFSTWRLALLQRLRGSADPVVAAVADKGVKELTYHRDHAARWAVRLGDGTAESHRRMHAALEWVWPFVDELFRTSEQERRLVDGGVAVDPAEIRAEFDDVVGRVLDAGTLTRPAVPGMGTIGGRGGRQGVHTEMLGHVLDEMQSLARRHAGATW